MPVALYVEQQNLVELWALFPESKRSKKKKKKICKTKCNLLNLVTNIHSKLLINRNAPMNRTPNNFLRLRYCSYENSNTLL